MNAIQHLLPAHRRDLGGFQVNRVLPSLPKQAVGPFIFFDHMGPAEFAPGQGIDVRPHPHIGLATVTYLFEGQLMHRDSLGNQQLITPGDLNWMTAGQGVVHSERTPDLLRQQGFRMHGIQSWFALPQALEQCQPSFQHYSANQLPLLQLPGLQLRVILGQAFGAASPALTPVETLYVAVEASTGAAFEIPADHAERAVYLASGRVALAGEVMEAGQMAILTPGECASLQAWEESRLMILGGEPIDGKRLLWWNFIASDAALIEQAKQRWQAGDFPPVPDETEFIPLPER